MATLFEQLIDAKGGPGSGNWGHGGMEGQQGGSSQAGGAADHPARLRGSFNERGEFDEELHLRYTENMEDEERQEYEARIKEYMEAGLHERGQNETSGKKGNGLLSGFLRESEGKMAAEGLHGRRDREIRREFSIRIENSLIAIHEPQTSGEDPLFEVDDPVLFHDAIVRGKLNNDYRGFVDEGEVEDLSKKRMFLYAGGEAGFCIEEDGNICHVYKNSDFTDRKHIMPEVMLQALANRGDRLDHFDGKLTDMYGQMGFEPQVRIKFDPVQAPKDWNYERDGRRDVIFSMHNGDTLDLVKYNAARGNYTYTLEGIPYAKDYVEAKDIQSKAKKSLLEPSLWDFFVSKGGPGSGNWGHDGTPGIWGGSSDASEAALSHPKEIRGSFNHSDGKFNTDSHMRYTADMTEEEYAAYEAQLMDYIGENPDTINRMEYTTDLSSVSKEELKEDQMKWERVFAPWRFKEEFEEGIDLTDQELKARIAGELQERLKANEDFEDFVISLQGERMGDDILDFLEETNYFETLYREYSLEGAEEVEGLSVEEFKDKEMSRIIELCGDATKEGSKEAFIKVWEENIHDQEADKRAVEYFQERYEESRDNLFRKTCSDCVSSWSTTSGDHDDLAIALQLAAMDEFNLNNAGIWYGDLHVEKAKENYYNNNEKGLRAFTREMYNNTQEYFQEQGITHVTMYRGARWEKDELPDNLKGLEWSGELLGVDIPGLEDTRESAYQISEVQTQPVSSFSSDYEVALNFANHYGEGDHRITMAAKVPVERILGSAQTGFGCRAEMEFVVMGGIDKYWLQTGGPKAALSDVDEVYEKFSELSRRAEKAKRWDQTVICIDAVLENADWTKAVWDLPPYGSDEFNRLLENKGMTLEQFKQLPAYQYAVEQELISEKDRERTLWDLFVGKGGPGSGNYGHDGTPGVWGGSAPMGEGGLSHPKELRGSFHPDTGEFDLARHIRYTVDMEEEEYKKYDKKMGNYLEEIEEPMDTYQEKIADAMNEYNNLSFKDRMSEENVSKVGAVMTQEYINTIDEIHNATASAREKEAEVKQRLDAYMQETEEQITVLQGDRGEYYTDKEIQAYIDSRRNEQFNLMTEHAEAGTELIKAEEQFKGKLPEKVSQMLAEIRSMGPDETCPGQKFAKGTRKDNKELFNNVREKMPTDWIQQSDEHPAAVKIVSKARGFYDHGKDPVVTCYGLLKYPDKMRQATAFHEFGHRAEYIIPGVKSLEQQFYDRRTEGKSMEWLGPGYSHKERYRESEPPWQSKYMGKDYHDGAKEIFSMGLDGIFNEKYDLHEDPDYLNFIFGVMATQ